MAKQQLSAPLTRLKRRARKIAREAGIPLHKALNQVAKKEGYRHWSLLAAKHRQTATNTATNTATVTSTEVAGTAPITSLTPGDLILIAARPGHGKTTMSLSMLLDAVRAGRPGLFFTLEYNQQQAANKLQSLIDARGSAQGCTAVESIEIDSSDDISAPYIISRLGNTPAGAVVVIDYLQLLDQKRTSPDLGQQLADLRQFATKRGICMIVISQVHRSFDLSERNIPTIEDVRLPNPVDLALFNKTCFLHNHKLVCTNS